METTTKIEGKIMLLGSSIRKKLYLKLPNTQRSYSCMFDIVDEIKILKVILRKEKKVEFLKVFASYFPDPIEDFLTEKDDGDVSMITIKYDDKNITKLFPLIMESINQYPVECMHELNIPIKDYIAYIFKNTSFMTFYENLLSYHCEKNKTVTSKFSKFIFYAIADSYHNVAEDRYAVLNYLIGKQVTNGEYADAKINEILQGTEILQYVFPVICDWMKVNPRYGAKLLELSALSPVDFFCYYLKSFGFDTTLKLARKINCSENETSTRTKYDGIILLALAAAKLERIPDALISVIISNNSARGPNLVNILNKLDVYELKNFLKAHEILRTFDIFDIKEIVNKALIYIEPENFPHKEVIVFLFKELSAKYNRRAAKLNDDVKISSNSFISKAFSKGSKKLNDEDLTPKYLSQRLN